MVAHDSFGKQILRCAQDDRGQYPRYVVKVHDEEGTIRKRGRKKHA
jgi:hypothetical protein